MLENVVLAQVFPHLNSQNLISNFQSAYHSGHKPKIADIIPIGYATFSKLKRGGDLAFIARSHILQHIAFKSLGLRMDFFSRGFAMAIL